MGLIEYYVIWVLIVIDTVSRFVVFYEIYLYIHMYACEHVNMCGHVKWLLWWITLIQTVMNRFVEYQKLLISTDDN